MKSITLRPKKSKEIRLLIISLIFIVSGIWLIKKGDIIGWVSVIFFGLGALVFVIKMLPGCSFLRLDNEGFTETLFFRKNTILWQDVYQFFVCYGGVSYDLSESEIILARTGGDGHLSDNYGLSAEKLVELLQEWKIKSQN